MSADVILQHVILPTEADRPICLYAREQSPSTSLPGSLAFDTLFNSFSPRKWRRYTKLTNLWFRCQARGHFLCQVLGLDAGGHEFVLSQRKGEFAELGSLQIPINVPEECCLVFCRFVYDQAESFEFIGGEFYTKADAPKYVNISIIFCTYNRESYLEKNIQVIREAQTRQSILCKHLQILVVDNGSSLDRQKYTDYGARLVHNINAGGSGGFARGMLELLDLPEVEYALLMDDDVELEQESLYRMIIFLSLLKDKYREWFLGGTMFSMLNKEIQTVYIESYEPGRLRFEQYKRNLNMCLRENLILTSDFIEIPGQYNAWWMCCIPVSVIRKKGLPMPFFLNWDDIEYGTRNSSGVITLNGICVWHQDFVIKHSMITDFLSLKNTVITSLITGQNIQIFIRDLMSQWCDSVHHALKLDYDYLEAHLLALTLVRSGSQHLQSLEVVKHAFSRLMQNATAHHKDYDGSTHGIVREDDATQHSRRPLYKKILAGLTLGGHLLPNFCTQTQLFCVGFPHIEKALCAEKICGLFPQRGCITIWRRDRKRFFRLLAAYTKECLLLLLQLPALKADYRKSRVSMASQKFWQEYLGLCPSADRGGPASADRNKYPSA